jgi:hypothetical protein
MMRVVIDTDVVLSGLIKPGSIPGQVLRAWRDGSFRLVLSEFLIEEIAVTLARPSSFVGAALAALRPARRRISRARASPRPRARAHERIRFSASTQTHGSRHWSVKSNRHLL